MVRASWPRVDGERISTTWRGDELRAYHDWLKQHGYVPDNDGKPQYGVVRRNGDVAYKSVVEVWKENDRRCAIVLAIGGSDKTAWSGLIFQDRDGDLLRRLRVNDVLPVEEDDAAAARVVGCPDWMPCPDGCSVCTWACGGLVASGAAGDDLSYGGCLEGCVELGNPFASGACGVACIGLVALGQYVLATKGCPAACRQIGSC